MANRIEERDRRLRVQYMTVLQRIRYYAESVVHGRIDSTGNPIELIKSIKCLKIALQDADRLQNKIESL